jgi:hypothetical protein
MTVGRNILAMVVAGLVLAGASHAATTPATSVEVAPGAALQDALPLDFLPADDPLLDTACTGILSFSCAPLSTEPTAESSQEATEAYIQADRLDSLGLCLSALLGLGLCKSVPWVRKFSFTVIPAWYHDGGPAQIGHSFAVTPDCVCIAPVCFVQPDPVVEDSVPRWRFSTVISLWRTSQFTPAVCAGRAPPCRVIC